MNTPHATLERGLGRQFDFSIGGVPIRLYLRNEEALAGATARYSAFAAPQDDPLAVYLEEFPAPDCSSPEFSYKFNGATIRARATESRFTGVRNEFVLDSLLRILLSWQLTTRAGFLLHAATVVRYGKAYVFTGRSGAGKSTVASLAPNGCVMTDEISLLRREEGEWRAYGTPFWGEFRAAGSNKGAPVGGIFRLLQSPDNRVAPLRSAELLRTLLPNVLFFSAAPEDNRRLLNILAQAVSEVPGYNLEFRKDSTFWEVLPS